MDFWGAGKQHYYRNWIAVGFMGRIKQRNTIPRNGVNCTLNMAPHCRFCNRRHAPPVPKWHAVNKLADNHRRLGIHHGQQPEQCVENWRLRAQQLPAKFQRLHRRPSDHKGQRPIVLRRYHSCANGGIWEIMKHLVELLICSTIGSYCLWRAASVLPRALAEAHAVVRQATERRREIEQLEEGVQ